VAVKPWLVVAGDFTPLGGMDVANYALARHLATRGELHLVTHRAWSDLEREPSVTIHRVRRPFGAHALGSAGLSREGARVWQRLSPRPAHAIVNGGNCDLGAVTWVHYVHAAYAPTTAGSAARRLKTACLHRRDVDAERRAIRAARLVICNSRRTRADVVERVGADPARVEVVYYGSDAATFSKVEREQRAAAKRALGCRAERPAVGFVGALGDRRKAFDVMFAAWTDLCRRAEWDADLIVAGAGSELAQWRQLAASAGIADRVRFLGFRADMPDVVAALDALVHPARYEAYGLSVHEAICRGVPALVSRAAGVAEQYPADLDDLLLGDPNDAAALAEQLARWRGHAEDIRRRVAPFSDRLRARTWDDMAAEVVALVERAGNA
jgi:glycosyltransferase involved in cell wall biosynthesis